MTNPIDSAKSSSTAVATSESREIAAIARRVIRRRVGEKRESCRAAVALQPHTPEARTCLQGLFLELALQQRSQSVLGRRYQDAITE